MSFLLASAQEIVINQVTVADDEKVFELRLETSRQTIIALELSLSSPDGEVKTVIAGQAAKDSQKNAFYDKSTGKLYLFGFNDEPLPSGVIVRVVVTGSRLLVNGVIAVTDQSEELPLPANNPVTEPVPPEEPDQ
jgi:hypothetical protein